MDKLTLGECHNVIRNGTSLQHENLVVKLSKGEYVYKDDFASSVTSWSVAYSAIPVLNAMIERFTKPVVCVLKP